MFYSEKTKSEKKKQYMIVFIINVFFFNSRLKSIIASASSHVDECEEVLAQMEKHSPQLAIDGYQNIWILKPGAKSRGRGIEVKNNLQDILNTAGTSVVSQKDNKWVVQKYIGMFNPTDVSCKYTCLLYTSPSPRDKRQSRMPSSA